MNKLTVFFEDPFWVGVFEMAEEGKLEICRVVFGEEPKDYEVYDFVLKNYYRLKFSKPVSIEETYQHKVNPKRMQREIKKSLLEKGVATKSQEAIKLDYESNKIERKASAKKKRDDYEKMLYLKRQEKKKQKKKGH